MAHEPTWAGLGKGLLVLGILWWTWIGYAWLTSVVDPEEGIVRLLIIAAMAALLVVSLCVRTFRRPRAALRLRDHARARRAHRALHPRQPRRPRPALVRDRPRGQHGARLRAPDRRLLPGLVAALGLAPRAGARHGRPEVLRPRRLAARARPLRRALRADRADRARRVDRRDRRRQRRARRRRHRDRRGPRRRVSAALFWLYFDVVALVAARRLSNATPGREQNGIARDSFTYLHLPMVAGIVLVALGFKKTLAHVHAHLHVVPAIGAARRHGALPARARRLPLAQRAPPDDRAARRVRLLRRHDRARGAHPGDRDAVACSRPCWSR